MSLPLCCPVEMAPDLTCKNRTLTTFCRSAKSCLQLSPADDKMSDQVDAKDEPAGQEDYLDARHEIGHGEPASQAESDFVSDKYNMSHTRRGIAIIINNVNFHPKTGMGVRTGSDVDANEMHILLSTLKFEKINVYPDLTAQEMKDVLLKASKDSMLKKSDCFCCVILSHGEEGYVFGTDDKIPIEELVFPFKGHNCVDLAGKPKIFFVQACRGTELDRGIEVADAGPEEEMETEEVLRRIPTEADFLMAYSVVPGFFAWRNSAKGSWFIQAIVDVFTKHWKSLDLLTMMTRVNKKVAYDFQSNASKEFMNRKKQIPCITSMLTKDVFFH